VSILPGVIAADPFKGSFLPLGAQEERGLRAADSTLQGPIVGALPGF
jgi:hypothetical protein